MIRLSSMLARVKLKGIDGNPHKRWSMWFNLKLRVEPYPLLTFSQNYRDIAEANEITDGAWLSSARVVRC